MSKEFKTLLSGIETRIFIPSNYNYLRRACTRLHQNLYTEFHIVKNSVEFACDERNYDIEQNSIFVVPANKKHHYLTEDNINYFSFQIDFPCSNFKTKLLNENAINLLFDLLNLPNIEYGKLIAILNYFICDLLDLDEVNISNVDYKLTISEFFSMRYSEDITIDTLANILCLSQKQTQRLVIKHTGNTFKNELIATRMSVAKHMIDVKKMSLKEVAEYVGYKSYSGFWKAYVEFFGEKPSNN